MKRLLELLFLLLVLGACGDDETSGGKKPAPKPSGKYTGVNAWMFPLMKQNYLWNEPLADMKPDYNADYDLFFASLLNAVAAQKDDRGRPLNYDDGHWKNNQREYYYSYVKGPKEKTRSAGDEVTETGLWRLQPLKISTKGVGLVIEVVTPGTPADKAGLKRGMLITHVEGVEVTETNFRTLLEKCYYGPKVRVLPNSVVWGADGTFQGLAPLDEVTLSAETFTDPALYRTAVVEVGGKRVGYLLYMGFETDYDEDLIQAFKTFRENRIDELVVDLRYNGGGAVRSSTLLATLIVGEEFRGQTYCRMVYNARRTARGETGIYCIGDSRVPDGDGVYTPISDALAPALGLRRIYVICSENTASASELLINGLRGFDLEVRLVGTQTNGKNVGMEGYVDHKVDGKEYTFMPITFYSENAKGFRDYSDGFQPDVEFDDHEEGNYVLPGDFATLDDACFYLILRWITTEQKPAIKSELSRAGATFPHVVQPLAGGIERPNRHAQGSLVFKE